jgi:hypothetical protein
MYFMHFWDNIKKNPKNEDREKVNWNHMSQDRDQWQTLLKTIMNYPVPKRQGISLLVDRLLAS